VYEKDLLALPSMAVMLAAPHAWIRKSGTGRFAEAGHRGVEVDTRYGIIAPAATPGATINRLQAAIVKALGTSEVRERYHALSLEPSGSTPQEFAAYLRDDIAKWRKVIAAAELPPQ
jgi:tripartite-type tricarboxylate transporter receptor subunit TctC